MNPILVILIFTVLLTQSLQLALIDWKLDKKNKEE